VFKCFSLALSLSLSLSLARSLALNLSFSLSAKAAWAKKHGFLHDHKCMCMYKRNTCSYLYKREGGREGEGEKKKVRKKKEGTPIRSNNGEKASYPHRGSAE
jgi:hypothetical protein